MEQHLLAEGKLLDKNGNLNEAGYAFSLVKDYDRKDIKANQNRIKEWDYYYFGNHEIGLALTIDDNSYMDLCSIVLFDYKKKNYVERSRIHFFSYGKRNLPSTSKVGDVSYQDNKVILYFNNDGTKREIYGTYDNFFDGKKLNFYLKVHQTRKDTMVIATPFDKPKHFYYNQKINNLVAEGFLTLGEEKKEVKELQGVLDWGRGVWTRRNTWYWASMNDKKDNHTYGFNFGYGFGDTSKASENMFFFDESAYKLNDVTFEIPKDENGKENYDLPWRMVSQDKDIDLIFTPIIHRIGGGNAIFVHSIQNQIFGVYQGKIKVDGKEFAIDNAYGFAEKVYNRW